MVEVAVLFTKDAVLKFQVGYVHRIMLILDMVILRVLTFFTSFRTHCGRNLMFILIEIL